MLHCGDIPVQANSAIAIPREPWLPGTGIGCIKGSLLISNMSKCEVDVEEKVAKWSSPPTMCTQGMVYHMSVLIHCASLSNKMCI